MPRLKPDKYVINDGRYKMVRVLGANPRYKVGKPGERCPCCLKRMSMRTVEVSHSCHAIKSYEDAHNPFDTWKGTKVAHRRETIRLKDQEAALLAAKVAAYNEQYPDKPILNEVQAFYLFQPLR